MSIAENIRRERRRVGMSQERLAERAGLSAGTIVSYEMGHTEPRPSTIEAIAHALGVDVAVLYATKTNGESNEQTDQ